MWYEEMCLQKARGQVSSRDRRQGRRRRALGVAGSGGVWLRRKVRLTLRIKEQEEEEDEKRL